jgi:hypothetical protein
MATLFQVLQFLDGNGEPLVGGKVYWYQSGTTIPQNTWVDEVESSIAANPVILDSEGRPDHGSGAAAMWIRGSYKIVLKTSADVTITTLDNINEYDQLDWTGLTATIADLNSTTTNILSKNSTYSVALADRGKTILCDATSGAFTINLPAAVTVGNKFKIIIKKIDKTINAVTIDGSGTETIDALTTYLLSDYNDFVEIHCDGSNWYLVAAQIRGTLEEISATGDVELKDNTKNIAVDASGGAVILTLDEAATVGSGYEVAIKKIDVSANSVTVSRSGADLIDGAVSKIISTQYEGYKFVSDGLSNHYIFGDVSTVSALTTPLPRNFKDGFITSNEAGDTDHDIEIAVGSARDSTNAVNMLLTSNLIKQIDAPWAAGTNAGGWPGIALVANTFYYIFIISKADGTVDAGFDSSLTATNLLTAATAAGYIYYRRIGNFYAEAAANVTQYLQVQDEFYFDNPPLDANNLAINNAAQTVITLTVPLGIVTKSIIQARPVSPNLVLDYAIYVKSVDTADVAINDTAAVLGNVASGSNLPSVIYYLSRQQLEIYTNTSAQIAARADIGGGHLYVNTLGYIDLFDRNS